MTTHLVNTTLEQSPAAGLKRASIFLLALFFCARTLAGRKERAGTAGLTMGQARVERRVLVCPLVREPGVWRSNALGSAACPGS
jgi:hypothetical protein